ncbi:Eco57I restriction-modification methylase domain-containing protein [Desulfobacterium sp. N47]|uniref:site-specific DNA-methyltransferase (adenine-specific) n=1 Tax=uncultured Desulfobacterium sp. TaxID=201089 RepID=E1YHG8_9BACT|nr:hypothetical protein N47_D28960 [uncultured Desulfobacterium sp.]
MNLDCFKAQENFYTGLKTLFNSLNIPVNYIDEKPLKPQDILLKTYKDKSPAYQLMNDVYILGMVDDKAFEGAKSADISEIKKQEKDYDGILIFGVTLTERENGLLPTRTQLAEVTRAFNREFYYTPVVVIFRYDNFISLASAERLKYKQEWREGEKAGKVSILRDIEIENPHTGHLKILEELKIARSGKKGINSFEGLYQYWQEVFSVNLLNKKFYSELSNWYFWAIKHVKFPSESQYIDDKNQQYKAQNVIRMLTRLLFVWFIKEKKLIPEELFDLEALQKNILKKILPFNEEDSLFKEENRESIYYKAILQNLFFATLNCPVKPDSVDSRERGFRGDESYGKHRGVDYLMRHKKYFKNPDGFLEMVNNVVPFLNGGLFECLDDKDKKIYIDGFSDNMSKTDGVINLLVVPDYLFFGREEKADLSSDYGTKNKGTKEAAVKGLINILKSYKFTIAENTPIEEDVALDPELLGKVFENLLASYNPETKTTARKQTGSFYTPREIVNYMVDESLIAHLKNSVSNWDMEEKELDEQLHKLVSFEPVNPFENNTELSQKIIHSLDNCKILDPACGSGAFPMGILQKMVHILQKVDPDNEYWRKLQLEKAQKATEGVFIIKDKEERKQLLDEINEAFDETINNPDYARKLFLIENCIYGVDIQPIAAQISKLRFFISLVVEQKVNKDKDNFGIRPLPNLETKFVTANTLIGIDKPDGELFYTKEVQEKEAELKAIRHKLFGAKDKRTKVKYRKKDEELRNEIADILKKGNLPVESAEQLASWDPYDQNGVSPFFDPEWMFDIKNGFDVVIGNPPYIKEYTDKRVFDGLRNTECYQGKMDLWYLFGCKSIDLLKENGNTTFIATNNWVTNEGASKFRNKVLENTIIKQFLDFRDFMIFESASIQTMVYILEKNKSEQYKIDYRRISTEKSTQENANELLKRKGNHDYHNLEIIPINLLDKRISFVNTDNERILNAIMTRSNFTLDKTKEVAQGIVAPQDYLNKKGASILNNQIPIGSGIFNLSNEGKNSLSLTEKETELIKPFYSTNQLTRYFGNSNNDTWVIYTDSSFKNPLTLKPYPNIKRHLDRFSNVITSDNKPYGLHRARNEYFFKGEKIISLRKCPQRPTFTFTDFDCYVSQTFFVIKTNRINQKYLTALFNSELIAFWLRNKGKMQGKAYQIDKGPILEIPIYKPESQFQLLFANIVDCILFTKETNLEIDLINIESIIDALVFELYFPDHMKERKIDVLQFVEKDIEEVMQDNEFETLNDTQKEQVITELHNRWSDPNSEIVKRMSSFSEKSPEILKPIIEL